MFDKNSKVECYSYSIDLSKPVEFFCKLIDEIGKRIVPQYQLIDLFNHDFLERKVELRFNRDESGEIIETIKEVASFISEYINKSALDNIDLSKTDIFLIYRSGNLLFSYSNNSEQRNTIKKTLTNIIKSKRIFEILVQQIRDVQLKAVFENLKDLNYDQHYSGVVNVGEKQELGAPFFQFSYLDHSKIIEDIIDEEDLIVDIVKINGKLALPIPPDGKAALINVPSDGQDSGPIGIKYDEVVFPIYNFNYLELIDPAKLKGYYWLLFKDVFRKEKTRKTEHKNELLEKFKADMFDPDLTDLLSYLKKNHYIIKKDLESFERFGHFFEEVNKISSLKHVPNLEFYVSDYKGRTALGIYSNERVGTNFNLLHWVRDEEGDERFDYFKDIEKPISKVKDKILALKPQLAFYFITNYFEDLLENAIKDVTPDYLKNFELSVQSDPLGEIDFLINTGTKFCFVEAKTKLTDIYIEAFIVKATKLLDLLKLNNIEAEFYLMSAYSDATCESKQYFIDKSEKEGYNIKRNGLNTIPYYFEVPIPKHIGATLKCISEPEFEKLKVIIQEICQK